MMQSRNWALRAARNDSTNLITPHARLRALDALAGQADPIAWAARRILLDGGGQQGSMEPLTNFSMTEWSTCVRRLDNWYDAIEATELPGSQMATE